MSIETELDQEFGRLLDEMKGNKDMPEVDPYGAQASASSLKQRDPSELEILASKFSSLVKELDDVYERMLHHNNTIHGSNMPMDKSPITMRGDAPEPARSKLNLLHHIHEVLSNSIANIRGEVNRMEQI